MTSLRVLLAVTIIQGVIGQDDTFSVVPKAVNIVPAGETVELECITREPVSCAWKLEGTELGASGFLVSISANFFAESGLRARDTSPQTTDCTIIIDRVERRHSGKYTCSPFIGGQVDSTPAEVIVAVKPASVAFTGDFADTTELTASSVDAVSVSCEARDARPKAELHWFLDGRELTDGVVSEETTDPTTRLVTSRSTLTHQFERQDEGTTLSCQASHPAYMDGDEREVNLDVIVQFAPARQEGSDLGTLYGYTDGEDKDLTISFTSNPEPSSIEWVVGPDAVLSAGQQTPDGRIIAAPIEPVDPETHEYALKLTFSPVAAEDHNTTFVLRVDNAVGSQEFRVRVAAAAPPPPPSTVAPQASEAGIGGGAIGGIIVGVIVLLAIIALVAFARSRGKWCFAAEGGGDTRKEWRAHMDPEAADKEGHDNPVHEQKPDADAANATANAEHHNGTNGTNGTNGANGTPANGKPAVKKPTDTPV